MTRIITALLLIPFIAWVTLASPQWVFLAVLAITGLLAYSEFDHIATAQGIARAGLPGMAAGLALLFAPNPAVVVVLIAMLGMTLALRVNNLAAAMPAAGAFTLGIVYIFGAWHCAADLRAILDYQKRDRRFGGLGGPLSVGLEPRYREALGAPVR